MKDKFENSKDIDSYQTNKDYSKGNSSPYREWQDKKSINKPISELNRANPDMLEEKDILWFKNNTSKEQKELINSIFMLLTKKQIEILTLVGLEGKTLENTAVILNIKKSTVQTTLNRIRKKLEGIYL